MTQSSSVCKIADSLGQTTVLERYHAGVLIALKHNKWEPTTVEMSLRKRIRPRKKDHVERRRL